MKSVFLCRILEIMKKSKLPFLSLEKSGNGVFTIGRVCPPADPMDAIQAGNLEMLKLAPNWRPRGSKFINHAAGKISNAVDQTIREAELPFSVPSSTPLSKKNEIIRLDAYSHDLKTGDWTNTHFLEETGGALDENINTFEEVLDVGILNDGEKSLEREGMKFLIQRVLETLTLRERQIINLYFGLERGPKNFFSETTLEKWNILEKLFKNIDDLKNVLNNFTELKRNKKLLPSVADLGIEDSELQAMYWYLQLKDDELGISNELIGNIFGLTRERIRQIKETAIRRLRCAPRARSLQQGIYDDLAPTDGRIDFLKARKRELSVKKGLAEKEKRSKTSIADNHSTKKKSPAEPFREPTFVPTEVIEETERPELKIEKQEEPMKITGSDAIGDSVGDMGGMACDFLFNDEDVIDTKFTKSPVGSFLKKFADFFKNL